MDSGYGAQVVRVSSKHSFVLDNHELENILMKDEVKDLPVVVVSVAGVTRSGKSFLLNFFKRYLAASKSARDDGSWIGDDDEPLKGFKWRTSIHSTTSGILLWSEPFINTLENGDKVAVILMDTQGTFDSTSTVKDCTTIFALSTLLSSVQIYNLSHNIQEDDLQHLQLFTAYGKLLSDQGTKAFQVLEFLVRDWQHTQDYAYGAVGGEQLLEERLKIDIHHSEEMKELRQHIRSCFERVSCFLMPHPGLKMLNAKFAGKLSDIGDNFKAHLKDLVKSLFEPEKLIPKTINGKPIKTRDLCTYFKTYLDLFNGGTLPNPTSLYVATKQAEIISTVKEALEFYENDMDAACGSKQPSVPAADVQALHEQHMVQALKYFKNNIKMSSQDDNDVKNHLENLKKDLNVRLGKFAEINLAKVQSTIKKSEEAYEEAIKKISKDQFLCVHPADLAKVHKAGFDAAVKTFDNERKTIFNTPDNERAQFIKSFETKYKLLESSNEGNNKKAVKQLKLVYWKYMHEKASLETPLSDKEFEEEHKQERKKILEEFNSMRNIPSSYAEDVHKYNLTINIDNSFIQLKAINKSMNKVALQEAIDVYDNYMRNVLDSPTHCMHPKALEHEHENGKCRALVKFRPNKRSSDGFDETNKDENTLLEILQQRFAELASLNISANGAAVQEAYNDYVTSMDELFRPSLSWALIIPMKLDMANRIQYHETSKKKAYDKFYSKRRNGGLEYSSDKFKDNLEDMINDYYASTTKKYEDMDSKITKLVNLGVHLYLGDSAIFVDIAQKIVSAAIDASKRQ